ncbi:MAG: hypothetical protein CM1200mP1_09860 [Candidatus Neomarinimicrobiota bacterium]|nr:MAG: hypothetical protein CM1200mP1_09860 [Candidatus Neomarinimicrobiota bacterium]
MPQSRKSKTLSDSVALFFKYSGSIDFALLIIGVYPHKYTTVKIVSIHLCGLKCNYQHALALY